MTAVYIILAIAAALFLLSLLRVGVHIAFGDELRVTALAGPASNFLLALALLLIVGIFAAVQVGHVMRMFRGVDVEKINATVLTLQSAAEELDMETINKAVDSRFC